MSPLKKWALVLVINCWAWTIGVMLLTLLHNHR